MNGIVTNFSSSFRHISICNSPHPAIMCSPDSSVKHCTRLSDLAKFFSPYISFGKSAAFFGYTATLTTGDTEYFIGFMLCASS